MQCYLNVSLLSQPALRLLLDAMRGGEHVLFGDERAATIELSTPGQGSRPSELVFPRVLAVDDLRKSRSPFRRLGPARFF